MTKNWSVSCENSVSIFFSCLCKQNECRFPVLLVVPIRTLQSYVCGLEQVKLYISSNIPLVAIDGTVVISSCFLKIIYYCPLNLFLSPYLRKSLLDKPPPLDYFNGCPLKIGLCIWYWSYEAYPYLRFLAFSCDFNPEIGSLHVQDVGCPTKQTFLNTAIIFSGHQ